MASQATLTKQVNALISLYIKCYRDKHKSDPTLNRYREKWGFNSMLEDLGYERAREVIEYYFSTGANGHTVQKLLQNYDRYSRTLTEIAHDAEEREKLRRETEIRVKEWLRGNEGTTSN